MIESAAVKGDGMNGLAPRVCLGSRSPPQSQYRYVGFIDQGKGLKERSHSDAQILPLHVGAGMRHEVTTTDADISDQSVVL